MELDSTINSHPIVQPVEHPDQITEIFDAISYSKGASVLRMLEDFMGPELFRIGVSRFLKKFKWVALSFAFLSFPWGRIVSP